MSKPTTLCGSALGRVSCEKWEASCCFFVVIVNAGGSSFFLLWFYGPGVVISQTQKKPWIDFTQCKYARTTALAKLPEGTQGTAVRKPPGDEVTFDMDSNISYPWTHARTHTHTHTHARTQRSSVTITILTQPWGTQKERQAREISSETPAFTTPTPTTILLLFIQHPPTHLPFPLVPTAPALSREPLPSRVCVCYLINLWQWHTQR